MEINQENYDRIIQIKDNDDAFEETSQLLEMFLEKIKNLRASKNWSKEDIIELFHKMIKDFNHKETGKYLDGRM